MGWMIGSWHNGLLTLRNALRSLMMQLLGNKKTSPEELKQIKELLNKLDKK